MRRIVIDWCYRDTEHQKLTSIKAQTIWEPNSKIESALRRASRTERLHEIK